MPRVIFNNGRPVQVDENQSVRNISRQAGVDRNHFLAFQNPNGEGYEIFSEKNKHLLDRQNLNAVTLPRYKQGNSLAFNRLMEELSILSSQFPVEVDTDNPRYVMILKFPLNYKWSSPSTAVLIKIPQDYPFVPPVHFFMKKSLTYNGYSPEHYFKDGTYNELAHHGWGKYCLHIDKNWKPADEIFQGDNLITFLELIKVVLDNMEREKV